MQHADSIVEDIPFVINVSNKESACTIQRLTCIDG